MNTIIASAVTAAVMVASITTPLTFATTAQAADRMPPQFIGDWCAAQDGDGSQFRKGRCPGKNNVGCYTKSGGQCDTDGYLIVRDRGFDGHETGCDLRRIVASARGRWIGEFGCEGEGAAWVSVYAISINPANRHLVMREVKRHEEASRDDILPSEFGDLPQVVQREVKQVRQQCAEQTVDEKWREPDPMAGISAFYLDYPAVLINNRHVCGAGVTIKGGNCHTWGCDVRVYRMSRNKEWEKILDEPTQDIMVNVGADENLRHLVVSFPGKYVEKCGTKRDGSWLGDCEYIVSWRGGRWVWQKLGGAR